MSLSRPSSLSLLVAASLAASCTFTDGQPWGQLDPAVSARLDAADRLDAQGRLRAGDGYVVQLDGVTVQLGALTLATAPAGGAVVFDPANPPAGYSLCHNGHCHADDGRLVDYSAIQIELAAEQGVASSVTQAIDAPLALAPNGQPARAAIDPALCSDACQLAPGDLSSVSLSVPAARLVLRAFDTRTPARLPADGAPFDLTVPLDWRAQTLVSGAIDKDTPVSIDLDATLLLTPRLFDGVDWTQSAEVISAAVAANIKEHSSLDIHIERRE